MSELNNPKANYMDPYTETNPVNTLPPYLLDY
jgi:hypothetical protein